jgi:hypothetical protein
MAAHGLLSVLTTLWCLGTEFSWREAKGGLCEHSRHFFGFLSENMKDLMK